ncbi:MAG TPA: zinc ribbon domain-containing protein [Vicinamibacterales bacterium]|nr:zinc ribbon domain-containing protein [Vicinamibacterales bacterium]
MPLFDFICRGCGREFEALVRAGHPPACPGCSGVDLDQKPAGFAVKSSERTQAFAAANRQKYSEIGYRESITREAEAKKHRDEDH